MANKRGTMRPDDLFTPEETALIQRLRQAPQPQLNPQAFQAMKQKILQELDAPSGPVPRSAPRSIPVRYMLLVGGIIVVLLIVASLMAASHQKPTTASTSTPLSFTATAAPEPSATSP